MDDSKQDALNAYWAAKTADQEREAFARMAALGMMAPAANGSPPTTVATISEAAAQLAGRMTEDEAWKHAILASVDQQIVATFEYPLAAVTPDMIAAGAKAWTTCEDLECLEQVYRAMAAVAPVELVPDGERIAVKERDAALTMRNETMAALEAMRAERDEGTARNLTLRAAFDRSEAELTALRAQMPELEYAARLSRSASGHSVDLARTMLAQRDAAEAELKTLRTRLTERDASLVKALRQRV